MVSVHPIGMSEQMDLSPLRSTMEHLYEGEQNAIGITLSSEIEFHDPLVVVRGAPRVMTMFRRLNRLFPQSKIHTFRPLNDGGLFSLCVHYRRRHTATPKVVHSEIELSIQDGQLIRMVEHWKKPVSLRGDQGMTRWVRLGLGRVLS